MKSLDSNALNDPSNPVQNNKLVAAPAANVYAYEVSDDSGESCEADDTSCANYKLTATFEGSVDGETTYTKSNLD